MIDQIQIVLVLFNTKLSDCISYLSLTNSLKKINAKAELYIYDNSPSAQTVPKSRIWNIYYYHDATNPGISVAYNTAAKFAEERCKKWLFFIDQDTFFDVSYLELLIKKMNQHPDIHIFFPIMSTSDGRIVSPVKFVFMRGYYIDDLKIGRLPLKKLAIINSGLCVSIDAFLKVGGYNENIKLDFSDHYFISKLKLYYSSCYAVSDKVTHELSSFVDPPLKVISRFKYYCNGARNFMSRRNFYSIMIVSFLRCIKLSFKYWDYRFLLIYFQYFLFGKAI